MTHIGLFEGIGGFSLAARWMGWETLAWCEWNEFGQKVLSHHFPNAKQHGDITKTDFTIYRRQCDVLTGGFPCQPYSTAGKRLGTEDDRHLWPEMLRAVREISPRYVVGENVRGLTNWNGGLVFDEVQADLEAEGYEVLPFLLPACAVNAPHRRDRIWFIAHSNHAGFQKAGAEQQTARIKQHGKLGGPASNTYRKGLPIWIRPGRRQNSNQAATSKRRESSRTHSAGDWAKFPTQSPFCNGNDGIPERLDTTALSFSKWRNESIKAGGNAIVPQVAFQIFKVIEQMEAA